MHLCDCMLKYGLHKILPQLRAGLSNLEVTMKKLHMPLAALAEVTDTLGCRCPLAALCMWATQVLSSAPWPWAPPVPWVAQPCPIPRDRYQKPEEGRRAQKPQLLAAGALRETAENEPLPGCMWPVGCYLDSLDLKHELNLSAAPWWLLIYLFLSHKWESLVFSF